MKSRQLSLDLALTRRSTSRRLIMCACVSASFLMVSGCIERAPTPASKRTKFDRSQIRDLLLTEVPSSAQRSGATFGNAVELAAYDFFPRNPKPGDTLDVTFFWRVKKPPEVNYKVFVHGEAQGAEGRLNADHWPAEHRYSTDLWQQGDLVRDRFSIQIPKSFQGDALTLWTGFYRPQTPEERWALTAVGISGYGDGKNRVRVVSIPFMKR